MKKLLLIFAAAMFVFTACEETEDLPTYFEVDGTRYELSVGYTSHYTTSGMGKFSIDLGNSATDPSNYISFNCYSLSTSTLNESEYVYKYYWDDAHQFSDLMIKGSDGIYLTESNSTFSGYISVSKANDNFKFEFDISAIKDGTDDIIKVTGIFNEVLKEGSIL